MANQQRNLSINLGFLQGITRQLKLIGRLMADQRVSPLIKLLPVGALVYLVIPTDLIPLLPFDDAAVLWLGGSLFVEMCPHEVVQEHLRAIEAEIPGPARRDPQATPGSEVIDAEFHDADSSLS